MKRLVFVIVIVGLIYFAGRVIAYNVDEPDANAYPIEEVSTRIPNAYPPPVTTEAIITSAPMATSPSKPRKTVQPTNTPPPILMATSCPRICMPTRTPTPERID